MKTLSYILTLVCAATLVGPFTALAVAAPPPNIVVFLVDDMGVMDTSVPFLDRRGRPAASVIR